MHEILRAFRQATLGEPWKDDDEIMICPNMRAAQVYLHEARGQREVDARKLQLVIDNVLSDSRVDQAIWRTEAVRPSARGYSIQSARGALEFWRGGDGTDRGRDGFGAEWSWRGKLDVIDAFVDDDGEIVWGEYPNAFERIRGALDHPHSATLWVTAQPGCEFEVPGGEAHLAGASHGGLHRLESECPVIVAGPSRVELPLHMRSIDVSPLCLKLLGLPSVHQVGEAR
jgi:hypothetical protein